MGTEDPKTPLDEAFDVVAGRVEAMAGGTRRVQTRERRLLSDLLTAEEIESLRLLDKAIEVRELDHAEAKQLPRSLAGAFAEFLAVGLVYGRRGEDHAVTVADAFAAVADRIADRQPGELEVEVVGDQDRALEARVLAFAELVGDTQLLDLVATLERLATDAMRTALDAADEQRSSRRALAVAFLHVFAAGVIYGQARQG